MAYGDPPPPVAPPRLLLRAGLTVLVGFVWLVTLTLVQMRVGGRLVVIPALSLAPLTASLVVGWRPTLILAAGSTTAAGVLSQHVHSLLKYEGIARTAGMAALGTFAVINAVIRLRRQERIRAMTEVATVAQATIMQPLPARVGPLDLASRYVSATADALVGGDLFDVVDTPAGVRLIIGDVRGKGLAAVRTAALALSSFRQVAPHAEVGLADVALAIEARLRGVLRDEDFVTVVLCQLDDDGRLLVANCGHHPPVRLAAGRPPEVLDSGRESLPLGLGAAPHIEEFELDWGDRLLLYTDGLIEARDSKGTFLDLADACMSLSRMHVGLDESLDELLVNVRSHVGGVLHDDLCVLLASRRPPVRSDLSDAVELGDLSDLSGPVRIAEQRHEGVASQQHS